MNDSRRLRNEIIAAIDAYEANPANSSFSLRISGPRSSFQETEYTLTYSRPIDPDGKTKLALDIFFDAQVAWERFQGSTGLGLPDLIIGSSFSVEDLPSDFLGFMEADGKLTIADLCSRLSAGDSSRMFTYGAGALRNRTHKPKLWRYLGYEVFVVGECAMVVEDPNGCDPCEDEETTIPAIFDSYRLSGNFGGPGRGFIRGDVSSGGYRLW